MLLSLTQNDGLLMPMLRHMPGVLRQPIMTPQEPFEGYSSINTWSYDDGSGNTISARTLTLTTLTGTILAAAGLMLMAQAPWLLRLAQTMAVVH